MEDRAIAEEPRLVAIEIAEERVSFQGLDLLGHAAHAVVEGLPFGVRHSPELRFRGSPVLNELLDGVVRVEELERVLLPPELQTMHDLRRLRRGGEVGEHRICWSSSLRKRTVRIAPARPTRVVFSTTW